MQTVQQFFFFFFPVPFSAQAAITVRVGTLLGAGDVTTPRPFSSILNPFAQRSLTVLISDWGAQVKGAERVGEVGRKTAVGLLLVLLLPLQIFRSEVGWLYSSEQEVVDRVANLVPLFIGATQSLPSNLRQELSPSSSSRDTFVVVS